MSSRWDRSTQQQFLRGIDAISGVLAHPAGTSHEGQTVIERLLALGFELMTCREEEGELALAEELLIQHPVPASGADGPQIRQWLATVYTQRAALHNEDFDEDDWDYIDPHDPLWALIELSDLARRLRLLQAATKTTAAGLGRSLGVGAHQISHWAADDSRPSPAHRKALAAAFGIHPAWLTADRDHTPDSQLYIQSDCPCTHAAGFSTGPLECATFIFYDSTPEGQDGPVLWCDGCGQPYLRTPDGPLIALPVASQTVHPDPERRYRAAHVRDGELTQPWPHALWSPGPSTDKRGPLRLPDLLTLPPQPPQQQCPEPEPAATAAVPASRKGADAVAAGFIRPQIAARTLHPGGTTETRMAPAIWTLAHRGYSGSGRLDVWAYRTEKEAQFAGAKLAMDCGMDEDERAQALFRRGRYQQVMQRYEETHPETHLLRVQPAFLELPA
ncbi:hypothetical protein [Streptomyces sp. PA03-2a]|uniref:helix-turn-helix domain-containing protein n=1 Tax=Streptomyces sp. PA03-2a TaxID=3028701 RepID=UPI0029B8F03D|nr:hypothetical protein [Streptomyces sp. PA03-2a]MDX2733455.1 hypothetical protein [Streptomyces sp. PA03-2a]